MSAQTLTSSLSVQFKHNSPQVLEETNFKSIETLDTKVNGLRLNGGGVKLLFWNVVCVKLQERN